MILESKNIILITSQMEIHNHWNETNCMLITWQYNNIHQPCEWAEHVQNYMVMEIQEKID